MPDNKFQFEDITDRINASRVRGVILEKVDDERDRQERLRQEGKFAYTCAANVGLSLSDKLAVLAEEFGEVARHVTEGVIDAARVDCPSLQKELIEVAAVAVAWAESLEGRPSKCVRCRASLPVRAGRRIVPEPNTMCASCADAAGP